MQANFENFWFIKLASSVSSGCKENHFYKHFFFEASIY